MKINLRRIDDAFHMEASNENGNLAYTDGSPSIGGGNKAMSPMQHLLVGIGGCSAIDIIHLLKKMRQPLDDIKVAVNGERQADKVPSLFEKITVHFDLYGDIEAKKAERAVNLSVEKYCSVSMILQESAEIEFTYTVHR